MKKIFLTLLTLILILSFSITVFALNVEEDNGKNETDAITDSNQYNMVGQNNTRIRRVYDQKNGEK